MTEILIRGQRVDIAKITVPWRLNILLDVSGSMDEENRLVKAKKGIETFLSNVSLRRQNPDDWVTASCFSGYVKTKNEDLYYRTMDNYCRIANRNSLASLMHFINNWEPVWSGTALYDAIVVASNDLYSFAQHAGGPGINAVIAVTDGEDNSNTRKPSEIGYPNPNLHLGLIGVGKDAKKSLSSLKPYASSTHSIDDFGELYNAMFVAIGAILEQQFLYHESR